MNRNRCNGKGKFRKPELEKIGWNVESLKKARKMNGAFRNLGLNICTVKMFVEKRIN